MVNHSLSFTFVRRPRCSEACCIADADARIEMDNLAAKHSPLHPNASPEPQDV